MTCTYRFVGTNGKQTVLKGQAAFKAFLVDGGLEQLRGEAAPKFSKQQNLPELAPEDVLQPDTIAAAKDAITKYKKAEGPDPLTAEERALGERLLQPAFEAAKNNKPGFDAVLDKVAEKVGGYAKKPGIKKMQRAVTKLATEQEWKVDTMKDLLRGTIVVSTFEEAQEAIDEIGKVYTFDRIKNRLSADMVDPDGKTLPGKPLPTGYQDILTNVVLEDGTVAEIQISTPEMIAAKNLGHEVYAFEREMPNSPVKTRMVDLQKKIYSEGLGAYEGRAANLLKTRANSAASIGSPFSRTSEGLRGLGSGTQAVAERQSGATVTGTSATSKNIVPGGKDLKSNFIGTSKQSIPENEPAGKAAPKLSRKQGSVLDRIPKLETAAQGLKEGTVTREQYDKLVNKLKPVTPYAEVPAPATAADMERGLTSDKVERIGVPSKTLKAGDPVGLRLDIPAYANHGVWVVSVHEQEAGYSAGKSIGYESVAAVTKPTFGVVEKAALAIAGGKPKATIAVMKGDWKPITPKQASATAKMAMKNDNWVQVGMDPTRHAYFYDRENMEPVVSADEAVQIGPLVLAKNPVYGKKSDFAFSKRQELRDAADAIAKMDPEVRDNTMIGDFPGAADGYMLYEARVLLKKPSEKLKRVNENNSFELWNRYDYIANVDGELFGVTKQEDPDEPDDESKFVYSFAPLDDPFKDVTTATDQTDELFKEMRASLGAAPAFSQRQKPVYTYEVVDPRDNNKVMGQYQSAETARAGRDRLDNKYGGYRYRVRKIESGEVKLSRRQTTTPEFKRWFGDSKVVNTDGTPKLMYHGTSYDISTFRPKQAGAIFLTENPNFAEVFSNTSAAEMLADINSRPLTKEQREQIKVEAIKKARKEIKDKEQLETIIANIEANKKTGPAYIFIKEAGRELISSGPNVLPVYVKAENPFDYDNPKHREAVIKLAIKNTPIYKNAPDQTGMARVLDEALTKEKANWTTIEEEGFQDAIKSLGFDSFYVKEENTKNLAVYKPEQIKSATGNVGTFDVTNPDIRFSQRQPRGRETEGWILSRDEVGRFRFGAGAKAYRLVADVANNVLDKVGLKPVSEELGRAMRKMKAEVERAQRLTVDVAGKMKDLPEQERQMISDVIEGELKRGVKPPQHVLMLAASLQSIMSEQSAELVRLGMLSPEAAGRWDGKYLPRFYEQKLGDEVKAWAKAAKALLGRKKTMQGIGGSSLKSRGMWGAIPVDELPDWEAEGWEVRDDNFDPATDTEVMIWRDYTRKERDDMGEIRDAMFRFVMGYNKSQRDIALGRLYESLATNYASKKEKPGYVKVPDTKVEDTMARRYGKLAGMWVPAEVLDHLSAFDDSQRNELTKMYLKGLSLWKEGKTVLNPVSHANNVLSNLTMAHFAGVSYWDIGKYAGAMRDLIKKSPMVEEALDAGLFGGTFNQAELLDQMPPQLKALAGMSESRLKKGVDTTWNALSWFIRKPAATAYQAEDQFFRYLIYRDARQRGLDVEDAIDYSQNYIFTYDDLPKTARGLRDYALPFFAYTYKVVPPLVNTALEKPWRYAAPAVALYTVNALMYAMAASLGGGDDEDWWTVIRRYVTDPEFRDAARALEKQERENLPPWMKGYSATLATPKAIRLGMDDVTNLPVFLDVSRVFPGGDLLDAHANAGGVPLLQPITPSNPVLNTLGVMLWNKDSFFGKDIVDKTDTDAEAAQKRLKWVWQQFSPAVAVGNYHWDRAMNVIANQTGQPILGYTGISKDGLPVQPGFAAAQTVGIKIRPIDLELSAEISASESKRLARDLSTKIKQIERLESKGAITSEVAETEIEKLKEKQEFLKEGLTVEGEEKE